MGCQYLSTIPSSPNINFTLDKPSVYTAPASTNIVFSDDTVYSAPSQPLIFDYRANYLPPSGNQTDFLLVCDDVAIPAVEISGESKFEVIHSDSSVFVVTFVSGNIVLVNLESSSVIDRGNWTRSNARIRSPVVSYGYAEMTPIVFSATNDIGDMKISSKSGLITVAVYELGQKLQFSDAISHLRGRVIFGYPKANIIRQVYEVSNNRSIVIPNVPEDPAYAIFLTTTDFNLTDEELRRGTVDMNFSFDHDLKDIVKISVWIQTPSGSVQLDRMKIFDYPGGKTDPHILYEPFKNTSAFRIPIHCISKKENQFYIEVEYKNADSSEIDKRSRVMLEKENYIIPFQAHFDNRNPYANIADHSFVNGPQSSSNTYSLINSEFITAKYCTPDTDRNPLMNSSGNPLSCFTQQYDLITRIFYIGEDLYKIPGPGGGNPNTYFIQEYTDLSPIQIGG